MKLKTLNADEVVTNLVDQVSQGVLKTAITPPYRDFKQALSENVQLMMLVPKFGALVFLFIKALHISVS